MVKDSGTRKTDGHTFKRSVSNASKFDYYGRLLELLRDPKGITKKEVISKLKINETAFRNTMNILKRDGNKIKRVGGNYQSGPAIFYLEEKSLKNIN